MICPPLCFPPWRETVLWEIQVFHMQKNALYVSLPCVSQNIDEINLHLWSERLHKYTIWGIKGPAQVKADWQLHCLAGLHFISRSPQWPQALWPWGQCQSLRMLIKWDQPVRPSETQVARPSSGESYLQAPGFLHNTLTPPHHTRMHIRCKKCYVPFHVAEFNSFTHEKHFSQSFGF